VIERLPAFAVLLSGLALVGCGYHTAGSATHIPANVRTIAVPIFATHAQAYHTEVALTQAVVRELNTRTRYRVLASGESGADAVLSGTILTRPRYRSPTTLRPAKPPATW